MVLPALAWGQRPVGVWGELDRYLRLLELEGVSHGTPIVFRANSSLRAAGLREAGHVWSAHHPLDTSSRRPGELSIGVLDPAIEGVLTSSHPRVANDGSLWAGRGLSATLTGGLIIRWRNVSGTLAPTLWFAQNRDFEIAPVPFSNRSPYAYQWHSGIDWPQRLGQDPLAEFDWGQSGVRVDAGAFTAGFSTENLWWGPGLRNALIMSNAGPGFPHADLGAGRPVHTSIGDFEVRVIWGSLAESAYFDTIPDNGRRYITGFTAGYRPSFLSGLTLGLTRVLYRRWPSGGLAASDLFGAFGGLFRAGTVLPSGQVVNDSTDQLASLVARWVFPESGFEAYVEWARGDFNERLRDFLVEPDHSRAFTAGFQKSLPSGDGRIKLAGELTTLGQPATSRVRTSPTFYVHALATQGYTHRGQLLGAAIGPGGQSQFFGVDRYTRNGRWGVFMERIRFDDDAYFRIFAGTGQFHAHQVEYTLGTSIFRFAGPVDLGGSLELSRMLNRYLVQNNDVTNLKLGFSITWRP